MKILLVHQYFKFPREGGAVRSYHLAKFLQNRGHSVQLLTTHNEHGKDHLEEDLRIKYFRISYSNHHSFLRRIRAFMQFVYKSKKWLKTNHDFDLAYVITTPLTTGLIALALKKKYGIPYVFEVGDLWPEAPIQLRIIRNRILKNWLYAWESKIYRGAESLVSMSPDIKRYIDLCIENPERNIVIPNFSDLDFFTPGPMDNHSFSKERPFTIGYFGAIGIANHLEFLVEFADEAVRNTFPLKVILMGNGKRKKQIMRLSHLNESIKWVEPGNKQQAKVMLDTCDAIYVSYKNVPVLGSGSPNKFFDGLAAGKLIILNFKGWMAGMIEEFQCGFSYNPLDPRQGVEKLKEYVYNPQTLKNAQNNARQLAKDQFEMNKLLGELADHIENEY